MVVIGTLPSSDLRHGPLYRRPVSKFCHMYGSYETELKVLAGDTFAYVIPRPSNVGATISSFDNKPSCTYMGSSSHNFGLLFLSNVYGGLMSNCVAGPEEVSEYIDWTKSPGWPWTYLGLRTKQEFIQHFKTVVFNPDSVPVWNMSGKMEAKEHEDILLNKIRVFIIPPIQLLWSQIKFGKRISLATKMFHWSYYGFNPYSGGFNRLAQRLLTKRWRGCYDVSGWDKFLPILSDVFRIVESCSSIPEDLLPEFRWMVKNTVDFLSRSPNGHVLRRGYGNPSGSGTTTRDNIFAHIIIFAAGLFKAHLVKVGCEPSLNFVFQQAVALFGDDNVFSVDDEFSEICNPSFLSEHLMSYGLKLKFFHGGLDADLSVLSFLGAHFKNINGYWYPHYDVVRMATSMVYDQNKLNLEQHICKAFTLTVMAHPTADRDLFRSAYKQLLQNQLVIQDNSDTIRSFKVVGLPTLSEVDSFYKSFESSRKFEVFQGVAPGLFSLDFEDSIIHYDGTAKQPNDHYRSFSRMEEGFKRTMMNTLNNPIVETVTQKEKPGPTASNKIVQAALDTGVISGDGYNWLTLATDPYHDVPVSHFSGIPDEIEGESVCMVINDSVNVSKPASFGASSNWNARITINPTMAATETQAANFHPFVCGTTNSTYPANITGAFASVNIDYSEGSNPFSDFSGELIGGSYTIMNVPHSQLVGPTKLAGMGVEVIDTSAEINKQGLVSCIDMNQDSIPISCQMVSGTGSISGVSGLYTVRAPPKSLSEMVKYQPIAQWEAKKGAYAVVQLKSIGTHPANSTYGSPLLLNEDFSSGFNRTLLNQRVARFENVTVGSFSGAYTPVGLCPVSPLNTKVIMLTGLNPNSTFTVRGRWVIEKYPNDFEPQILPMVTPTANYDPAAIEIYSRIINSMPPMVPLSWNASRQWWKNTLSSIADIIATGLLVLPHPLAKGAGAAMQSFKPLITSGINHAVDAAKGPKKQKKRVQQNNKIVSSYGQAPKPPRAPPRRSSMKPTSS